MEKTIPHQLAIHIDSVCGVQNTGGVAQFFDEDGNLQVYQPGKSAIAYTIACSLMIYEESEHDDYKTDVQNMVQADIDDLNKILSACDSYKMPEPRLLVDMNVLWTDPDDGACNINGEIYSLVNESRSKVEASSHELEVQE